jgi:hypothetical protein
MLLKPVTGFILTGRRVQGSELRRHRLSKHNVVNSWSTLHNEDDLILRKLLITRYSERIFLAEYTRKLGNDNVVSLSKYDSLKEMESEKRVRELFFSCLTMLFNCMNTRNPKGMDERGHGIF